MPLDQNFFKSPYLLLLLLVIGVNKIATFLSTTFIIDTVTKRFFVLTAAHYHYLSPFPVLHIA